ncbi:MAG: methyltransferase domain-containing protein [Gammaproteobacteria bacterium]
MHDIDQTGLRRANDAAAAGFEATDFFCAEVRERLFERLSLISLKPERILVLGTATGSDAQTLRNIYPETQVIALDWSLNMLHEAEGQRVCADAHQLPFVENSFDMVVSNLMLPGCGLPEQVFHEANRLLKHPGLFLFSSLGPDSLRELRKAWNAVDTAPHVYPFADMHNVGDALVQAGFREPVMDVEHLTVTYDEPNKLVADLRAVAATNLLQERRRGLTSPRLWQQMLGELDKTRNAAGRLPVSLEVITGQAWVGQPAQGVQMVGGEARVDISDIITRRKD